MFSLNFREPATLAASESRSVSSMRLSEPAVFGYNSWITVLWDMTLP